MSAISMFCSAQYPMSHTEAYKLLTTELGKYRAKLYDKLAAMVGDEDHPAYEINGDSGVSYWLEIEAFQDSSNVVRIRGAICGGGIDYQAPLCDDFLMQSDGTFVGESSE